MCTQALPAAWTEQSVCPYCLICVHILLLNILTSNLYTIQKENATSKLQFFEEVLFFVKKKPADIFCLQTFLSGIFHAASVAIALTESGYRICYFFISEVSDIIPYQRTGAHRKTA